MLEDIKHQYLAILEQNFQINRDFRYDDRYFSTPAWPVVAAIRFLKAHLLINRSLLGPHGSLQFRHKCEQLCDHYLFQRAIEEHYINVSPQMKPIARSYMEAGYDALISSIIFNDDQIDEGKLAIMVYRLMFGSFRQMTQMDNE